MHWETWKGSEWGGEGDENTSVVFFCQIEGKKERIRDATTPIVHRWNKENWHITERIFLVGYFTSESQGHFKMMV